MGSVSNILTEDEVEAVVMALANGQEMFTEKDAVLVVREAEKMAVARATLEMILDGRLNISVKGRKVLYSNRK